MQLFQRYLFLAIIFLFGAVTTQAQFQNREPVKWDVKQVETADGTEIQMVGSIDKGWYIYSMFIEGGGPTPTEFTIDSSEDYKILDEAKESATIEKEGFDKTFEIDVKKLIEEATLSQKIEFSADKKPIVQGNVLFQVCNEEMCLPPTEELFAIDLASGKKAIGEVAVREVFGNGEKIVSGPNVAVFPDIPEEPISDCSNEATATNTNDSKGVWSVFLLGLFGGLIALLTPCVFPMIPLTVTFFTKRHDNKAKGIFDAILYGLSIFMIYFLLALPFLIFKMPQDALYRISTSPILNLAFFVIFVFFALSLFGFFELTLPSNWANKTDQASNKGGLLGIFFMAITLVIVSFSCTGPILGSLMAGTIASEGGQYKLVAGMSGFGVALGLPFALFAMFPGVLKKLPKSGSWMNTVKVVLAFVELALAMKFLSNADLVKQWGLLKYETFTVIWVLIFLGLAAYLFGLIRFPHDYKGQSISIARKVLGLLSLVFAGFIGSALFGNSMGALSGFWPPKHYSYAHKPTDQQYVKDFNKGAAQAKVEDKPILLDFTGWSCVNCREVEQNIWTDPEVARILKEDVVLVSLYADDSEKLPKEEQYFSENLERTVKTVGQKWTDFEDKEFGQIAQPLYALVTADGKLLNSPIAYTKSVQDYLDFLDCGINTYNELAK